MDEEMVKKLTEKFDMNEVADAIMESIPQTFTKMQVVLFGDKFEYTNDEYDICEKVLWQALLNHCK